MSTPPQTSGPATPVQAIAGSSAGSPSGSKTPPRRPESAPALSSTPASHRIMGTSGPYSSTFKDQAVHRLFGLEVSGRIAQASVDEILGMLPCPPMPLPAVDFSAAELCAEQTSEPAMYEPFISAFQGHLAEDWQLVNTSSHEDPSSRRLPGGHAIKPDVALYRLPRRGTQICSAAEMESAAEFKINETDEPFQDASETFEKQSEAALATRGQVVTYINAIQALQMRTRVFSFFILKRQCRLLFHSRAGTLVSPRFDYTKNDSLHKFFWRYSHASRSERGHDDTVQLVNDDECPKARKSLHLEQSHPLYRTSVDGKVFYMSEPFTRTHMYPIGRGTRCYSAYDPASERVVVLKDSWRIRSYEPEGQTYQTLNASAVRNIPGLVACGDVGSDSSLHQCGDERRLPRILRHYRLVLDVVGQSLVNFSGSWHLVNAIKDALIAHQDAFGAGILHGDISAGNIIIGPNGGLLIDWELSKSLGLTEPRALERTGTLQFMACRLLVDPDEDRALRDDIESFLHVLLWTVCRHARGDMQCEARVQLLQAYDGRSGVAKAAIAAIPALERKLKIATPQLAAVVKDCAGALRARIAADEGDVDDETEANKLLTHDWLIGRLEEALKDDVWHSLGDAAVQYVPYVAQDAAPKEKKRSALSVQTDSHIKRQRIESAPM